MTSLNHLNIKGFTDCNALNMLSLGSFGHLTCFNAQGEMPDFGYSQFKAIDFCLAKPALGGLTTAGVTSRLL